MKLHRVKYTSVIDRVCPPGHIRYGSTVVGLILRITRL